MPLPERPSLAFPARFDARHIGPSDVEVDQMLKALSLESLDQLVFEAVPDNIRLDRRLDLNAPKSEHETLVQLKEMADQNEVWRSFMGMGYARTIVPPVIQRNVLENPGWYTQYTPYQSEIAQGRLEALLNFQTMVSDLCGLPVAGASLLDEGTAAAEAMSMLRAVNRAAKKHEGAADRFFVDAGIHPQTLAVLKTRAEPVGIELVVDDAETFDFEKTRVFGAILQVPATDGVVRHAKAIIERAHQADALVTVATDLLALMLLESPGAMGADVAVGSSQRFGVPLGFGGPHAAFFATKEEFKRQMPGRIVGVSQDRHGNMALRLALQTREQHIRREKATSNICTAQVLLAIMSGMYATYHGPHGLRAIAERVHFLARTLRAGLDEMGHQVSTAPMFDTVTVSLSQEHADKVVERAAGYKINLRRLDAEHLSIALDEPATGDDLDDLFDAFDVLGKGRASAADVASRLDDGGAGPEGKSHLDEGGLMRSDEVLTHPVFHAHRSETEMLRYLHTLQKRDLSLTTSMIPLGSCTMKLNATSEMLPVTWETFSNMHPFAPDEQTKGYRELFTSLEGMLAEITGFSAVSLQPNAGSQGEYTGMLVIRAYHRARGEEHRNVCLIPSSAHGTNPASAVMAGMKVVVVQCSEQGAILLDDLKKKAAEHADNLAAIMVTYPSTFGVFEKSIVEVCDIVHEHGGQVYLDGANMNAQVGLCRPGDMGADVCHLNLHKTFCIPHGGGGPGMGPIGVAEHLAPFLPGHPVVKTGGDDAIGAVSAAPWGSPSILPISWVYIALLGAEGLTKATQVAILNANYMVSRLEDHYPILYRGNAGRVAHEFILNCNEFKKSADIVVEDIAKRLIDYGFHSPTMSWPVPGTLMVEPTESEPKHELDRFCDAMIAIRAEIQKIEDGEWDKENNPLKNAPHPAHEVCADEWTYPYSRQIAAFPLPYIAPNKFWPAVGRVDNVAGDRNVICTCPPISDYQNEEVG